MPKGEDRVVCPEYLVDMGCTEELQHGEVGLTVAAVSGGVDEHDPIMRPDDVATPQVAVDAPRRFTVVGRPRLQQLADRPHGVGVGMADRPDRRGHLEKGSNALLRIEPA